MDEFIKALGPVFAAGLAIQQIIDFLDAWLIKDKLKNKKAVLYLIALILGVGLAFWAGLRVLYILGQTGVNSNLDMFVTGVLISGGTELINSIVKFLGYSKDNKKEELKKLGVTVK